MSDEPDKPRGDNPEREAEILAMRSESAPPRPPKRPSAGLDDLPHDIFSAPKAKVPFWRIVLVANSLVLVALLLLATLRRSPELVITSPMPLPASRPVEHETSTAPEAARPAPARSAAKSGPPSSPAPATEPTIRVKDLGAEAISLQTAETAFAKEEYGLALARYNQLLAACAARGGHKAAAEFFTLRMAQCRRALGRARETRETLTPLLASHLPAIRGTAHYHLASLDMAEGQPSAARLHAYRALAMLEPVPGTEGMRATCELMVAAALSRKALTFFNQDKELPPLAWSAPDPFAAAADEDALREILSAGVTRLADATLGPHVAPVGDDPEAARWTVTCTGGPIEELLQRVAGSAGVDVLWTTADPAVRRRAVWLALDETTAHRAIEVAAGAAGLVARLTGEEAVLHDPRTMASTDALRDLLLREGVSAWRRLFLRSDDPQRLAWGHFSLGLLHELQGEKSNAMSEYRLLTDRYEASPLAPRARLRGAIVRIDLRDYRGAREALLDLLNRHPEFPDCDEVYLRLGQAALEAGLLDEAAATYRKLFNLELSLESRRGASFGAGRALHLKGEHEAATEWLLRFINLSDAEAGETVARAGHLLGLSLTDQGRHDEAIEAFGRALDAGPGPALRAEVLLARTRAALAAERYADAFAAIDALGRNTDPTKRDEALLLEGKVLRAMHLPQRAAGVLRRALESPASTRAGARMGLELARCYRDAGDPAKARRTLAEVLPKLEPPTLAHEAAWELSEIALEAGQAGHAVGLCREILKRPLDPALRRRTLETLGAAYTALGDHTRAALALSGTLPALEGEPTP